MKRAAHDDGPECDDPRSYDLQDVKTIHRNAPLAALCEMALARGEVKLAGGGAIVAHTGPHTGRANEDKFFVDEPSSTKAICWGKVNQPIAPEHFDALNAKIHHHLKGKEVFIQDCYCGADPDLRLPVRVITETAWHSMFAHNMFIQPEGSDLADFSPGFTVIHAPSCRADPAIHGTHSETFILIHMARRLALIGGTAYAGEIKKSVFSVMNYLLPEKGILPMHCSANIGTDRDVAIFFGLSGTGKTTLSADLTRTLIGDDEHGWGPNGIFNFEGGCYAKLIRLSAQAEPQIYATTGRFGTILENVVMDEKTRMIDLDDARFTENSRGSYPLEFIPNASKTGRGGHPQSIIMLTADAFGVLPPISRLTPEQALYHFLSGYTARVAGTEKGVGDEPQATFSTCFGAPFLPLSPSVYAELFNQYIKKHQVQCWLVNTGWSGGAYGSGSRIQIAHTRAMIQAALNGALDSVPTVPHPYFGIAIPQSCPDIPAGLLDPKKAWPDPHAYDQAAENLTRLFAKNFKQYADSLSPDVIAQTIRAA